MYLRSFKNIKMFFFFISIFRMFFVLHANVCGKSLPHHGHSHENGHGHSHGGDHGVTHDDSHNNTDTSINAEPLVVDIATGQSPARTPKQKNINVRAAIIHVIGDFVQSVGVLCAAILIYFKVRKN
jgi:zinc transporter 2